MPPLGATLGLKLPVGEEIDVLADGLEIVGPHNDVGAARARLQACKIVVARFIGDSCRDNARAHIPRGDFNSGNQGAAGIRYGPAYDGVNLRKTS